MKKLLLLTFTFLISANAFCALKISTTPSGLWSAGATWVGGVAPVAGDTIIITSGTIVTVDTAFDIGTNVAGSTCLTINGTLDFPYTVNSGTWNFRGRVQLQDGYTPPASWLIGTAENPVLSTNTVTLIQEGGGSVGSFYFNIHQGTYPPNLKWYGSILSTNTLACPTYAITTNKVTTSNNSVFLDRDIDAKTGQIFIITGTESSTECETLTVLNYDVSVPSITFTTNFTKTHNTGAYITNLSRNIIFKSTTTAQSSLIIKEGYDLLRDRNCEYIFQNVEFNNLGAIATSGMNIAGWGGSWNNCTINNCGYITSNGFDVSFSSCIFYNSKSYTFINPTVAATKFDFQNCLFIKNSSTLNHRNVSLTLTGFFNFEGCLFSNSTNGVDAQNTVYATFTNCKGQVLTTSDFTSLSGSAFNLNIDSYTYNNIAYIPIVSINYPIRSLAAIGGSNFSIIANNFKPKTTTPLYSSTPGGGAESFFSNGSFSGGEIRCQNFNQEVGLHKIIGAFGLVESESTTVRTVGVNGLKFSNGNSYNAGLEYVKCIFKLPANTNDTILFRGFSKISDTYTLGTDSSPYVRVYSSDGCSDNTTTTTESAKLDWELLSIACVSTSTGTISVELCARLSDGCTAYFSDCRLYVGNNVYALGVDWVNGYPQASPVANTVDSTNIWGEVIWNGKDAKTVLKEIRRRDR